MYITDNTSNTGSQLGPWEVFFAVEDELARSAWFWPARQPTVRSDWTRSRPRAGLPSPRTNRRATTRCRAAPLRRVAWILFSRRRTIAKNKRRLPDTLSCGSQARSLFEERSI